MQQVIVSTHNYFPLHKGGTEVYIDQLCNYLHHSFRFLIVASSNEALVKAQGISTKVVNSKNGYSAFLYQWNQMDVLGIETNITDLELVYSRWIPSLQQFFADTLQKINWHLPRMFWLNGFTTVSSLSLVFAVKQFNEKLLLYTWLHTPFTCFKDTLLHKGTQCSIQPSVKHCSTCSLYDRLPGKSVATNIFLQLPAFTKQLLPQSIARINEHVTKHLAAIQTLNVHTRKWICFTTSMQGHLHEAGIEPDKIAYAMHGINTGIFHGQGRTISPHNRFLYAGRWEEVKGFNLLAKAWLQLPDDASIRTLSIVGEMPEVATIAIQKMVAALKNRKDVQWLGHLSQHQLATTYRNHDVLLIPSMWVETGPMVFHEAIACGCSVIGSDIGGIAQLAKYYHQSVFECGNAAALLHAIKNVQTVHQQKELKVPDTAQHFDFIHQLVTELATD